MKGERQRRILEAVHQEHRGDIGRLALQLSLYRQQLIAAGIEPDDRDDEDLMKLWRASANTISAAAELTAVLGSAKELLDPDPWRGRTGVSLQAVEVVK